MSPDGFFVVYTRGLEEAAAGAMHRGVPITSKKILDFSFTSYMKYLKFIYNVVCSGPNRTYAHQRLLYLGKMFELHTTMYSCHEVEECKSVPHRDFYNVMKVDTHIHHSSSMNQKHLLKFIKNKLRNSPEVSAKILGDDAIYRFLTINSPLTTPSVGKSYR